ncbi:hypothetical protein PLESTB_001391200 [Pleodorina starrii]|uniref:ATP-dependent Clp protease proteolytic subunit n=1 Tax=Pleodorina starrii TaxID=330485 RepID=A0A9W6BUN1_9CHLO|nr:hypothetical protein PLESTM_000541300 [Pleodorina starrii]GLC58699.1 hypothetical protein PLESTB_001391200 [Pleodorina starrii]GLC75216.1 hypothetical protein PLESTF_001607900 [Pleodorina starrii]
MQRLAGSPAGCLGRCPGYVGKTLVPQRLTQCARPSHGSRRGSVVVQARKLAHLRKKMWKEAGPPPDLATRLFTERIMYLGMPIDSSVAELLTAQLIVLVQEAPDPIFFYINSTGIAKSTTKFGNEHEAIAVYHMMKGVQKFCPIYTLCVGNAFGEAALLLSAGSPGKRAALRSATIMLRQPLQRLNGMQASDIDIYRKITREKTQTMAKYLAACTKKTEEQIEQDFARPRYFNPYEAVSYGLIDTVLEPKEERVVFKDWEKMGSEIAELGLWDDEEQPLPTNIMYPGTSQYWRSDFDG